MNLCERLREGLDAGDPSVLADPALQAHLETCAACRDAVDADSALRQALAGLGRPPMSPELRSRLMALVEDGGAGETAARAKTASWMSGPINAEQLAGRFRSAPTTRERLVAAALLVACLAGLAFVLKREQTAPANLDGTPQPLPTAATREALVPSPPESQATAWPTPLPPLPPLPMVADEGLALPEGALVALQDDAGLLLFRGNQDGRRLVEDGAIRSIEISPDGRWVAYETATDQPTPGASNALWVLPVNGGAERKVVEAAALTRIAPGLPPCMGSCTIGIERAAWSWTPDSAALAFTTFLRHDDLATGAPAGSTPTIAYYDYSYRQDLWLQAVAGGPARLLFEPGKGGHVVYAPDGAQVAISQSGREGGLWETHIAVARADGSEWRRLLRLPHMSSESDWTSYPMPQWTGDSRQLLLAAGVQSSPHAASDGMAYFDGPVKLIRLALDGSVAQVAEGAGGSIPMFQQNYNGFWSPDGERLAYYATLPRADDAEPTPMDSPGAASVEARRSAYPAPGATAAGANDATEAPSVALMIASVADGSHQVYDWLPGPTSRLCLSPSGTHIAYAQTTGSPSRGSDATGRLGTLGEAPRSLPIGFTACRWLSEDLLLLSSDEGLLVHRLDGHERLLWAEAPTEYDAIDVHVPAPLPQ